jgi:hypothetical protein
MVAFNMDMSRDGNLTTDHAAANVGEPTFQIDCFQIHYSLIHPDRVSLSADALQGWWRQDSPAFPAVSKEKLQVTPSDKAPLRREAVSCAEEVLGDVSGPA